MPRVALEASTDDLADFIDAQPMSAATRYTYIANPRRVLGVGQEPRAHCLRSLGRVELRAPPTAQQCLSLTHRRSGAS